MNMSGARRAATQLSSGFPSLMWRSGSLAAAVTACFRLSFECNLCPPLPTHLLELAPHRVGRGAELDVMSVPTVSLAPAAYVSVLGGVDAMGSMCGTSLDGGRERKTVSGLDNSRVSLTQTHPHHRRMTVRASHLHQAARVRCPRYSSLLVRGSRPSAAQEQCSLLVCMSTRSAETCSCGSGS